MHCKYRLGVYSRVLLTFCACKEPKETNDLCYCNHSFRSLSLENYISSKRTIQKKLVVFFFVLVNDFIITFPIKSLSINLCRTKNETSIIPYVKVCNKIYESRDLFSIFYIEYSILIYTSKCVRYYAPSLNKFNYEIYFVMGITQFPCNKSIR